MSLEAATIFAAALKAGHDFILEIDCPVWHGPKKMRDLIRKNCARTSKVPAWTTTFPTLPSLYCP